MLLGVLAVLLFCVVANLMFAKTECRACGRILIAREPLGDSPYWMQDRYGEISNVLCSSRTVVRLAAMSKANESDFKFVGIHPVRSTMILEIEYAGTSSSGVEHVASNACEVMIQFYMTNNPPRDATNYGAYIWQPAPAWERVVNRLQSLLP